MAARGAWSGHVRISLVSFGVKLFPAFKPSRAINLHQVHKPSGERVRYQTVVPDIGPVDRGDIVKGYEVGKGEYVLLEQGELGAVRLPSTRTLDIVQFVDADAIDALYFDRPYFVVPADKIATEAFAVVREALKATRTSGIGEIVLSGKEHLAALRPCGRGMVLETLRYGDEVRRAAPCFEGIPDVAIDEDRLGLAEELIKRKKAKFDASKFSDGYEDALRALIDAKLQHQPIKPEAPRRGGNVVDLMDALRRSIGSSQEDKKPPRSRPASGHRQAGTNDAAKPSRTPSRRRTKQA